MIVLGIAVDRLKSSPFGSGALSLLLVFAATEVPMLHLPGGLNALASSAAVALMLVERQGEG